MSFGVTFAVVAASCAIRQGIERVWLTAARGSSRRPGNLPMGARLSVEQQQQAGAGRCGGSSEGQQRERVLRRRGRGGSVCLLGASAAQADQASERPRQRQCPNRKPV